MFDAVTLDQLRAFVTVVERGSFSAAARELGRVQSAVSTAMANLESQLGLPLWDRSTKVATLTGQGRAVLVAARRVLGEVDGLARLTGEMNRGLEPSVSLCVDALFPLGALVQLCSDFARQFPSVDLRVDTQVMSAVTARVASGRATIGVVSPLGVAPGLERKVLAAIQMVPVAGPGHPLASHRGPLPLALLERAVQIVLSEGGEDETPSENTAGRRKATGKGVADQAVLSARTWRVGDLHTKHALLRANLGWGNLPEHLARADLEAGKLVPLRPQAWAEGELKLHLSAVYRASTALGPAHAWMLDALEQHCVRELAPPKQKENRAKKRPPPNRR